VADERQMGGHPAQEDSAEERQRGALKAALLGGHLHEHDQRRGGGEDQPHRPLQGLRQRESGAAEGRRQPLGGLAAQQQQPAVLVERQRRDRRREQGERQTAPVYEE